MPINEARPREEPERIDGPVSGEKEEARTGGPAKWVEREESKIEQGRKARENDGGRGGTTKVAKGGR